MANAFFNFFRGSSRLPVFVYSGIGGTRPCVPGSIRFGTQGREGRVPSILAYTKYASHGNLPGKRRGQIECVRRGGSRRAGALFALFGEFPIFPHRERRAVRLFFESPVRETGRMIGNAYRNDFSISLTGRNVPLYFRPAHYPVSDRSRCTPLRARKTCSCPRLIRHNPHTVACI